jgi:hypothetical protein
MPDKETFSVPFEGSEPTEQELWAALRGLPRGEPSGQLRRRFYSSLHQAGSRPWTERLGQWLGLRPGGGWVTAAACLVLGFGFALVIDRPASETPRLVALERNLAQLQRDLILDRLQDASANTRLKGVVDATRVVASDPQVVQALLVRAAQDRSPSVRSAAIDALGSQLRSGEVETGLMSLLEGAESPIVQLALVDLFLRHGDAEQIRQLQALVGSGRLHPDLVEHITNAVRSKSI